MGEGWRILSGEQAQELIDNCNWEWVNNYENTIYIAYEVYE